MKPSKVLTPYQRRQLRQEKNQQLPREEAIENARERALRALDRASQSRADLEKKLVADGYQASVIDEVLERLTGVGLIDDEAYALMLIRTRYEERGLVGRALEQELMRKGISYQSNPRILSALEELDLTGSAYRWAEKKAASLSGVTEEKAISRLAAFLGRKGYPSGICWTVARQVWEENNSAAENF